MSIHGRLDLCHQVAVGHGVGVLLSPINMCLLLLTALLDPHPVVYLFLLEKDMKQVEEQLRTGFVAPPPQCHGFGPRGRGLFRGGRGGFGLGRGGWAAAGPAWSAMMRGWTGDQPTSNSQEKSGEKHQETQ